MSSLSPVSSVALLVSEILSMDSKLQKNAHSSSSMFAEFWLWAALRSKSCQPKCSVNFFGRPSLGLTVSYAHEFPYCHVHSSFTAFAVYGWLGGKSEVPLQCLGPSGNAARPRDIEAMQPLFSSEVRHKATSLLTWLHCTVVHSDLGCIDKQNAFLTHVQKITQPS